MLSVLVTVPFLTPAGSSADFSIKAVSTSSPSVQDIHISTVLVSLNVPNPTIFASAGANQSTGINSAFTTLLQATVTDSAGNPVLGSTVAFNAPVTGASGTFAGGATTSTAFTNSSGVATAPAFTANGTAGGPYNVLATAGGVPGTAVFPLTNTGAVTAAGQIRVSSGGGQSTAISTQFPLVLTALLTDANGNPLSGAPVTFYAPAGGPSGTFANGTNVATPYTNAQGLAISPAFTANAIAGTFNVTASSGSIAGAVFTMTNSIATTVTPPPSSKTTPVISWSTPAPITVGQPLDSRQLNATANVAGTFLYSPGAGSVLAVGLQTLSATFTPTNTTLYNSATAQVTLSITAPTQADQFLTFPPIPDHISTDTSFTLSATATSGLPVSYRLVYGPATVTGNLVTLTGGLGRVDIEAVQPGNTAYNPSNILDRNFLVVGPVPVVTSIVDTVTNQAASLSPGSSRSLLGTNLSAQTMSEAAPFPVQIGSVTLIVTDSSGISTPMLLVSISPTRIDFVIPSGIAPGNGTMRLVAGTGQSLTMKVVVGN